MADRKAIFKRFKQNVKAAGAASVDPLCNLLASLGFAMIITEVCICIMYSAFGTIAPHLMFLIPLLSFAGGYLVQSLVLLPFGREEVIDYTSEGMYETFDMLKALPAVILAVLVAAASKNLFYAYLLRLILENGEWLESIGVNPSMDSSSLQPLLCSLCLFIGAAAGIVVRFFPYNRIMSYKSIAGCTMLTLVLFIWSASIKAFSLSSDNAITASHLGYITVCYVIYIVCAVLVANQSYIIRTYRAITVTRINTAARMYNMRMVLLALILTALAGCVAYIFVRGLYEILYMIFFVGLTFLLRDRGGAMQQQVQSVASNNMGRAVSNDYEIIAYISGFLMVSVAVIFVLFFARSASLRDFFDAIRRWFDNLISTFMGVGQEKYERPPEINYKDIVETVEQHKKSRLERAFARKQLTLRDFNSELAAMKTMNEKLEYSYAVMLSLLSGLNLNLRASDTPRELSVKIENGMTFGQIGEITSLIERIKYAEQSADSEKSTAVLNEVCAVIAKHLY
ncbi:MAG: hypothetical protein IJ493_05140 [Clostridia bacterium]|nr:hypothetical protein [Clostridia bacterium]